MGGWNVLHLCIKQRSSPGIAARAEAGSGRYHPAHWSLGSGLASCARPDLRRRVVTSGSGQRTSPERFVAAQTDQAGSINFSPGVENLNVRAIFETHP
jgi:hypothetical protein